MDEKLGIILKELGSEGIQAFYVYTALDFITMWVIIGLAFFGVRAIWRHETRKKHKTWSDL